MKEEKSLIVVRKKKDKVLILNIIIIILGTIFISLGAFHSNIWFDESYSVAIANHNFREIWNIGGNDVHPVFYYIMLKIVSLIFTNNILTFRLFSIVPVIILSILGITHIRKDYGEKTGVIFSFLTLFLPIITVYASQIRMYTWVMLFVSITAIYANRVYKKKNSIKDWILFSLFSLLSSYTHYYGLMTTGIINIYLFIFFFLNKKERKKDFINFIIQAIIQILIYTPWLFYFVKQLTSVRGGFWIELKFPDILFNVIGIQYMGSFSNIFGFIFAICLYTYLGIVIYKCKKQKVKIDNAIKAISVYCLVIIIAFIISLKSPIIYPRYLMALTGLLIFFVSDIMAKEKHTYITIEICIIIFVISLVSNIQFINNNYDKTNMLQVEYLKENIKKDDILIYSDIGNGCVFAVNFKYNNQYFYNIQNWNIKQAYKAYSPQMETVENLEFLNEYKGRIWIIDSYNNKLYNEYFKDNDKYKVKSTKKINTKYPNSFDTKYTGYSYNLVLLEKFK